MAKVLRAAEALVAAFGCLVVFIHHCGVVGTRPRGHTSLTGAADVQISVLRDSFDRTIVSVEYAKDFEPGPPLGCRTRTGSRRHRRRQGRVVILRRGCNRFAAGRRQSRRRSAHRQSASVPGHPADCAARWGGVESVV